MRKRIWELRTLLCIFSIKLTYRQKTSNTYIYKVKRMPDLGPRVLEGTIFFLHVVYIMIILFINNNCNYIIKYLIVQLVRTISYFFVITSDPGSIPIMIYSFLFFKFQLFGPCFFIYILCAWDLIIFYFFLFSSNQNILSFIFLLQQWDSHLQLIGLGLIPSWLQIWFLYISIYI